MQYRHVILSASIVLATGCPSEDPASSDPAPSELAAGSPAPAPTTTSTTSPATTCPAPVVCPAPARAPTCPAPVVCPAPAPAVECPAAPAPAAECPVCSDPYPAMPTTYGASDAWPLPTDHPHELTAFCRVTLPTTSSKGSNGIESTSQYDVGCGEVNDTERGCYGPHGADYVDTCVAGAGCWVDYWIPGTNTTMRTAYGKCIAQ
jgi:hypothetical protein